MPIDYTFSPTKLEDITQLVQDYVASLSSPIDSFLEHHILEAQAYTIFSKAVPVGYFAVYEKDRLTQFYLKNKFLKAGQPVFSEILDQFSIASAFIPTCDELFLSYALDRKVTIENQAYFFQDNKSVDLDRKRYQGGHFRPANLDDVAQIQAVCGDFFDTLADDIAKNNIFVFMADETLLGAGIIEKGRLLKGYTSIGMFTNERFRQRGVGRSIIIYLREWCYENGQIPIAGCWYHNTNSKRTLESAGMLTKTRLLNISFVKK